MHQKVFLKCTEHQYFSRIFIHAQSYSYTCTCAPADIGTQQRNHVAKWTIAIKLQPECKLRDEIVIFNQYRFVFCFELFRRLKMWSCSAESFHFEVDVE